MNSGRETPLLVAVKGMLAGMGGAMALMVLTAVARALLGGRPAPEADPPGLGMSVGQALAERPGMPPHINQVTATFIQKVANGIFGTTLTLEQQYLAGLAWHFTYGGFWGMLYALLQSSLAIPSLWLSLSYGFGVWAIGPGWLVPKMKLMLPPAKQRPHTLALVVGVHLAYSLISAQILYLLRKD
jgi:hypothetical protein